MKYVIPQPKPPLVTSECGFGQSITISGDVYTDASTSSTNEEK